MSNTLTGLIPTIYSGLDVVSREMIGFIPNVSRDAKADGAAIGQKVTAHVVPQGQLEDIVPGVNPANTGDHNIGTVDVEITNSKAYPIKWSGEEQKGAANINLILRDQFSQAFRTLANAVEKDIGLTAYKSASRAYGTAGTTPFATADDMTDLSEMNRILDDNGAPATGRKMIVGSAARAKLEGKQSQLFKANEAGTDALLRNRQMRELSGFVMGYSAGVALHTKGTGTGYLVNNGAGELVGDTDVTLDTGTAGATGIKAGDVVTFAGDSSKYVVKTGLAGAAGVITLGKPGLRFDIADNAALTVGNSYTANLAFSQDAILLAARTPAMPEGGDEADDVMNVTDPVSGLVFQIAIYRQYRQVKYEVSLAWGVKAIKEAHIATLLG